MLKHGSIQDSGTGLKKKSNFCINLHSRHSADFIFQSYSHFQFMNILAVVSSGSSLKQNYIEPSLCCSYLVTDVSHTVESQSRVFKFWRFLELLFIFLDIRGDFYVILWSFQNINPPHINHPHKHRQSKTVDAHLPFNMNKHCMLSGCITIF